MTSMWFVASRPAARPAVAPKPPLTCGNADVTGATRTRFDESRRGLRNVLFVARERRDARPRGRAAGPEAKPLLITSTEVARVRASAARIDSVDWAVAGSRDSETPI